MTVPLATFANVVWFLACLARIEQRRMPSLDMDCIVTNQSAGSACSAGGGGGEEWAALRPRLLPAATAWLDPHGAHGWGLGRHETLGLVSAADPAAAAANLLLFLLRREARPPHLALLQVLLGRLADPRFTACKSFGPR